MTGFSTARLLAGIIEVVGGLFLVLAALGFFVLVRDEGLIGAGAGAAALAVIGLFAIAGAQLMRAQIVTAESSERMARELEALAKALRGDAGGPSAPARAVSSPAPVAAPAVTDPEMGKPLRSIEGTTIYKR